MYQGTLKFLKHWYDCSHCGECIITKVIPTYRYIVNYSGVYSGVYTITNVIPKYSIYYIVNLFTGVSDYRQFIGYS